MATVTERHTFRTLADLQDRLGHVPPERVCMNPLPGTATREDLLRVSRAGGGSGLFELVAGTLVEKTVGRTESEFAMVLGFFLLQFLGDEPIASVTGPDMLCDTLEGRTRGPDVAVTMRDRLVESGVADEAIQPIPPDFAVEILSRSNTPKEMANKLLEYFNAGVRLVWYVDPRKRSVRVFTSPNDVRELTEDDTLDGGDVLPGFELSIHECFQRAEVTL